MIKAQFESLFTEIDLRHSMKIRRQLIFDFKAIANIQHEGYLMMVKNITE
jgi:hypothetical protein